MLESSSNKWLCWILLVSWDGQMNKTFLHYYRGTMGTEGGCESMGKFEGWGMVGRDNPNNGR